MALFTECMQSCAHIVLDTADIVREAILEQLRLLPVVDNVPLVTTAWLMGH